MTIFENKESVSSAADNQQEESITPFEKLLEKYKDTEGISKAFTHAQAHINKLEREREAQRKDMETRLNLEELVSKLASRTNDTSNSEKQMQNERQEDDSADKSFKQEDIAALIEQTIERKQTELSKQANIRTVSEELRKAWGPDYVSKLKEKAKELELSESFIDDAASKSPKAVLSLLLSGEKGQQQQQKEDSMFSPPRSSVNTSSLSSKTSSNALKEHYSKMRKEDPKKYWSPKVQNEMYELVVAGKLEL